MKKQEYCKRGHLRCQENLNGRTCRLCNILTCKKRREMNPKKVYKESLEYIKTHQEKVQVWRRNTNWRKRNIKNPNGTFFTVSDYNLLEEIQTNKCAICKIPKGKTYFAVDHDHKTGIVRGLLCALCNRFIVFVVENYSSLIPETINYLRIRGKPACFQENLNALKIG